MKRWPLLAGLAFLLSGCGGGGGTSAIHPSPTSRSNQPGDAWNYVVSIDFGKFGSYRGTLSDTLSNDTFNGAPSIRETQVFDLLLKTGPSVITSYAEYSTTGQLLAETIDAVLQTVQSDTFATSGTFALGNSDAGTITFASGLTIAETYKVVSVGAASTSVGSFDCWIVDQTAKRSDGVSDRFVLWIAPETGNSVRMQDTTNNGDGTGYTYTASLTSMATPQSRRPFFSRPIGGIVDAVRRLSGIPR
ncbi:MAG: hypothetical protein P4L46_10915 [Fimbriimonas sp.]|nr:hypothetical protein [Fimbriimonas sp.]